MFEEIINGVSNALYSYILIILLIIGGLFFCFKTRFVQFRFLKEQIKAIAEKPSDKKGVMNACHIVAALLIFIGAGLSADLLWNIADITMGGMTIINIPVIIILCKYATAALKDYESQLKLGKKPVFKAKNINLPHDVDCWK